MTQVIPVSSSAQTQFDIGDGTTTAFQLPPQAAADFFGAPSIYLTDALGNRQLSLVSRTQRLAWTQDFTQSAYWVGGGYAPPSITQPNIIAPDGSLTGQMFARTTVNACYELQNVTKAATAKTFTASLYVKQGTARYCALRLQSAYPYLYDAIFDLQNLTTSLSVNGTAQLANGAASIIPCGSGWYRCVLTGLSDSTTGLSAIFSFNASGTTVDGTDTSSSATGYPWGSQLELGSSASSYIPAVGTINLVAPPDFSISSLGIVNVATAPMSGAILLWSGTYLYVPAATADNLVNDTLLSQYANSPTLLQLIQNFETYINPAALLDDFYTQVWDVLTATGFGLDIWGAIVGVTRYIKIAGTNNEFGFKEGGIGYQPFGQGPFNGGTTSSTTYTLSDAAFRTLILVKALSNISNSTAPSYNNLLQNLFAGRGRCYVTDTGKMQILFTFEFNLLPYEVSIITNSGAFPRPAAVKANLFAAVPASTFGFREGQVWQPFGQGVFANSSQLINVA